MNNKIVELFGTSIIDTEIKWNEKINNQICPFTGKKCYKVRKSTPDISIGTCTLEYRNDALIICPNRLLEKKQVFMDCIHLLKNHEPGNELHVIPEVSIPGGSVDYVLASIKDNVVKDFVGIEFQTLDTTGTVWPERQRLLIDLDLINEDEDAKINKTFGINWKMTAKTILVQMHHKSSTFENMKKHLVLVIQQPFLEYMRNEFDFSLVQNVSLEDSVHIHSYNLKRNKKSYTISLNERCSTDSYGISKCLGLKSDSEVNIEEFKKILISKMSDDTLLTI